MSNPSQVEQIEYACDRCGSVAVTRDAWAEWNGRLQAWVLSETFDFAFCHECQRATRLSERPLAPEG